MRFLWSVLVIGAIYFVSNLSVVGEFDGEGRSSKGEQSLPDEQASSYYNNELSDDSQREDGRLVETKNKNESHEWTAKSKGMVDGSMKSGISSEVKHEDVDDRKKRDALILIPLMFVAALLAFIGMWAGYRIQPMTYSWVDLIDVSPFSQVCGRIAAMIAGGVIGGVLGYAIWLYVQVNVL